MKQFVLISLFFALAACGTCHNSTASVERICSERNLTKGTPEYHHCIIDEQNAAKLDAENRANLK